MRKLKLVVEYDGTHFVGWQYQDNGRSVQLVLESALKDLLQSDVQLVGAGRTDAGVHALGQAAHFTTNNAMDSGTLLRGINALLPDDVVVRSVEEVKDDFHARYGARWRKYRYSLSTVPVAVGRAYVWFISHRLDPVLMQQCASQIVGEHDFKAFCKAGTNTPHFRCVVRSAEWKAAGYLLNFEIEANRFLYGMVRALVGTMVEIGRGYRKIDDFDVILKSGDRREAGMAAPAAGLTLVSVSYE